MKKIFTIFFCVLLLVINMSSYAFASEKSAVVTLSPAHAGTLTWVTGTNKTFIINPSNDYYFSYFTLTKSKKKVQLPSESLNHIRITVKGQKYYEYFPSREESIYRYMTVAAYNQVVEQYVKANYGTTSYVILDTYKAYINDSGEDITVHFKEKKDPSLTFPSKITTNINESTISTLNKVNGYNCAFKSSNNKVCTIDKNSGLITLKGEGISTITITVKATDTTKEKSFTTTLYSYPLATKIKSIKATGKVVTLAWSKEPYSSGYKIKYSQSSSFTSYKTKVINSPKALKTEFKNLKSGAKYYFKILSYKRSCGKILYSKASNVKSIKTK